MACNAACIQILKKIEIPRMVARNDNQRSRATMKPYSEMKKVMRW